MHTMTSPRNRSARCSTCEMKVSAAPSCPAGSDTPINPGRTCSADVAELPQRQVCGERTLGQAGDDGILKHLGSDRAKQSDPQRSNALRNRVLSQHVGHVPGDLVVRGEQLVGGRRTNRRDEGCPIIFGRATHPVRSPQVGSSRRRLTSALGSCRPRAAPAPVAGPVGPVVASRSASRVPVPRCSQTVGTG